jgi:glycine oxidase
MNDFPTRADVVIAGGGVIGLAIARSLTQRRIRNVVVIERGTLGAEASSAAAGMLAPQAEADTADEFFSLCCRSRDMYAHFAETLYDESGIDIELDTTGTLYLAFTDHDREEIENRYDWQTRAGLLVDKISLTHLRQLEPCISEHVIAALKFSLDIQVENRRLVSALATSNARAGVKLITGTSVRSVHIEREQVKGIETSRGFVGTEMVVLAGGAWTSFISSSDQAFPNIPIEPVRGQMLSFECNPRIAWHVIYSPRGYIVPRRDGRLLAGSTTEHAGFDKSVTAGAVHSVLIHALEISPTISTLPLVASWAGLRPRSPDDLPVLGPCAAIRGLVYATGHYRNGILLAPLTGDLIAGAIADNVISPLLGAFGPDRFELSVVR